MSPRRRLASGSDIMEAAGKLHFNIGRDGAKQSGTGRSGFGTANLAAGQKRGSRGRLQVNLSSLQAIEIEQYLLDLRMARSLLTHR